MIAKLKIRHRVNKGIRLLNKEYPGWKSKIELSSLRLEDRNRCVLGQVYGGYDRGVQELGLGIWSTVYHGFNIESIHGDWEPLQKAWERKLVNA